MGAWFISMQRWQKLACGAAVLACLCAIAVTYEFSAPKNFPAKSIIVVPQDANAAQFATQLESDNVIRSRTLFMLLARLTRLDRSLDPGAYIFSRPIGLSGVVWRVGKGMHGVNSARITFTEGMTVRDYGDTLKAELPGFNEAAFLSAASTSEGYLFPDTYEILPGTPEDAIVVRLRAEFSQQIATITPQIMAFGKPFDNDVIMASILEREARSLPEKRMVAGILWKRLAKGIPLQVDATFGYIRGDSTYIPTGTDRSVDSPYNTYTHPGLPPTPIANPGLEALLAAITPTDSPYLYYLTGTDGEMHYAKTYEEHQENIEKYLK